MTAYRLIGDRILVRRDPKPDESDGLVMPDEVRSPPRSGIIEGIGDEVAKVTLGERVLFSAYAGIELETTTDFTISDLIVMREDEILVIEVPEEANETT